MRLFTFSKIKGKRYLIYGYTYTYIINRQKGFCLSQKLTKAGTIDTNEGSNLKGFLFVDFHIRIQTV